MIYHNRSKIKTINTRNIVFSLIIAVICSVVEYQTIFGNNRDTCADLYIVTPILSILIFIYTISIDNTKEGLLSYCGRKYSFGIYLCADFVIQIYLALRQGNKRKSLDVLFPIVVWITTIGIVALGKFVFEKCFNTDKRPKNNAKL